MGESLIQPYRVRETLECKLCLKLIGLEGGKLTGL